MGASAAGGAKGSIDHGVSVDNGNGASFASLFTLFTADTAHLAGTDDLRAFICAVAQDGKGGVGGKESNKIFGTSGNTTSATATFAFIGERYAVHDGNCTVGTSAHAVAQSDATAATVLDTAGKIPCDAAIGNALVGVFFFCFITTCAKDAGNGFIFLRLAGYGTLFLA